MNKTAAIRLAKAAVPPPRKINQTHFLISVPVDWGLPEGQRIEMAASSHLEAQHVRAYALCRIALVHMGLQHVRLVPKDGGTLDQLMAVALRRAAQGPDEGERTAFWQIRLSTPEPDSGSAACQLPQNDG